MKREKSIESLTKELRVARKFLKNWIKPKATRRKVTILLPPLPEIYFELIQEVFLLGGYSVEQLPKVNYADQLKAYKRIRKSQSNPSNMFVAQLIVLLKTRTSIANNAVLFIPKRFAGDKEKEWLGNLYSVFKDEGLAPIPVVMFSHESTEMLPWCYFSPTLMKRFVVALQYADLLTKVVNAIRPYEKIQDSTNLLCAVWLKKCKENLQKVRFATFEEDVQGILGDFTFLRTIDDMKRFRIGLLGDRLGDHPTSENYLQRMLEKEGWEVESTPYTDGILTFLEEFVRKNSETNAQMLRKSTLILQNYLLKHHIAINEWLEVSNRFSKWPDFNEGGNRLTEMGKASAKRERWSLKTQFLMLKEEGIRDFCVVSLMGESLNHIFGKSMLKEMEKEEPRIRFLNVPFEPELAEELQEERLRICFQKNLEIPEQETVVERIIIQPIHLKT